MAEHPIVEQNFPPHASPAVQWEENGTEIPLWWVFWESAIHTVLSTIYFILITLIAVAIDLGLHWFESLAFVEYYGLSRIIKWEIELMAYTLATVDCFLFMRKLIQPVAEFLADMVRAVKR